MYMQHAYTTYRNTDGMTHWKNTLKISKTISVLSGSQDPGCDWPISRDLHTHIWLHEVTVVAQIWQCRLSLVNSSTTTAVQLRIQNMPTMYPRSDHTFSNGSTLPAQGLHFLPERHSSGKTKQFVAAAEQLSLHSDEDGSDDNSVDITASWTADSVGHVVRRQSQAVQAASCHEIHMHILCCQPPCVDVPCHHICGRTWTIGGDTSSKHWQQLNTVHCDYLFLCSLEVYSVTYLLAYRLTNKQKLHCMES